MHHLLCAGRERHCSARSPCARTVGFKPPRPRVRHAPRRRFDGSRRSPGWMPLPPARPHKPAGVAARSRRLADWPAHARRDAREQSLEAGGRRRVGRWAVARPAELLGAHAIVPVPVPARPRTHGREGGGNQPKVSRRRAARGHQTPLAPAKDAESATAAPAEALMGTLPAQRTTRRKTKDKTADLTRARATNIRKVCTKRRLRLHLRRSHSFPTTSLYL